MLVSKIHMGIRLTYNISKKKKQISFLRKFQFFFLFYWLTNLKPKTSNKLERKTYRPTHTHTHTKEKTENDNEHLLFFIFIIFFWFPFLLHYLYTTSVDIHVLKYRYIIY